MTSRDEPDAHSILLLLAIGGVLLVVAGVAALRAAPDAIDSSLGATGALGLALSGLGGLMILVSTIGWGVRLGVVSAAQSTSAQADDHSPR